MGVIYKITNIINNKIYIGQTKTTEPQRWQGHIWHAYNNPENDSIYLCRAIKKYGKENFRREVLEEVNNDNELNNKEIYYIKLYNSTNSDIGYNLSKGGEGYTKYSTNQILKLYEQYKSIVKVSNLLGANKNTISKRLRGMGIDTYNNTILQFDFNGKLICTYNSFSEAKRITTLNLPNIIPYHHYCCNYFWVYDNDNFDINIIINNYRHNSFLTKDIEQYNFDGELLNTFPSAAEASRILNINISSIKAALNNKQVSAGGYIWHKQNSLLTFNEQYTNFLLSSSCSQIEEVDLNNNIIQTYSSAGTAEKELGWSYNSIKVVCDGKRTHTHGRIFRYSNKNKRHLLYEKEGK